MHLGVIRVAPHVLSNTHNENHEENIHFCNVQHLSRWYGVLAMVSGWYGFDCRLAGLCISFTASWLNEICYYMPSLLSLDEWQSLPNFAQTKSDLMNAVGLQKESIELVASLIYQPSRFASTARRAPLQIFAARSFYTVCHRNVRLRSSLKNWTMNF
jgi:hypothetical protein